MSAVVDMLVRRYRVLLPDTEPASVVQERLKLALRRGLGLHLREPMSGTVDMSLVVESLGLCDSGARLFLITMVLDSPPDPLVDVYVAATINAMDGGFDGEGPTLTSPLFRTVLREEVEV